MQSGNSSFLRADSVGNEATTAIWELETFWWQVQLEGDGATTASGNLRFFGWQAQLENDQTTTAHVRELSFFLSQSLRARTAPAYKHKNVRELLFICGWAISTVMWDLIFHGGGHLSISCLWLFYTSIVCIEMNEVVSTSVVRRFEGGFLPWVHCYFVEVQY